MRSVWWVVVIGLGLGAGCKKDAPSREGSAELAPEAGSAAAEAASAAESAANEDAQPYVLTAEKLDAYVRYQRKVQAAYASVGTLARELQVARSKSAPGKSPSGMPGLSESMKAIESKAQLEDQARRDEGLSAQDVNRIGALVTDVITQRHMAAMVDLPGELQRLEQMQARLKPEQAAALAPQIDAMRLRLQETDKLGPARQAHGDANVDLVLTREQELMNNYQDMLRSFGGRAQ